MSWYYGPSGFVPKTAVFDGTNDYAKLTSSGPTGLADFSLFTLSFWFKLDGGNAANRRIFSIADATTNTRFSFYRDSSNNLRLEGKNSSNTTILSYVTSATYTSGAAWRHALLLGSTAADAGNKLYINGSTVTWGKVARSAGSVDGVGANYQYTVGSNYGGGDKFYGAMAELWFDDSAVDNPSLFASGGYPIDLGADGSVPTGSAPVFYFSRNGSGDSWATDSAHGNAFTVTGALGTSGDVIHY